MGTSVPAVTPLQQIDDAWGNQVRAELDANDAIADRLVADSGNLTLAPPSGWNQVTYYRRVGAWVQVEVAVNRSGATIAAATDVVIGTLPVGYRPTLNVFGFYYITAPAKVWTFTVAAAGTITLDNVVVNSGQGVRGSAVYPVALP